MKKSKVAEFQIAAADMDSWLQKRQPEVFSSLGRAATDKQLAKLSAKVFSGKKIPPMIDAWFRWHNGQSLDGSAFLPLYKHSPFYLADISESISVWRDMSAVEKHGELSGPWSATWLPILVGEFGDVLVLVTSGRGEGEIRACWHESSGREVVAKDLLALLNRSRRAHSSSEGEHLRKNPKPSLQVPVALVKGSDRALAAPTSRSQLDSDEIGTVYFAGPMRRYFYPFKAYYVAVKVGSDLWISAEEESREIAMQKIRDAVAKAKQSKWAHTSTEIASEFIGKSRIRKGKVRFE